MSKSPLDREFDAGSGLSVASLPTRGSSASSRGDRRGGAGSAGGATAGNSFASSSLRSSVVQPRSEDFSIEKIAKDLTTVMADEEEIRERELQMALTRQQFTINRLNLGELEVYGRDKEVAVLTELFQAVSTARAAAGEKAKKEASVGVVNVVGKAGTGKSRLCKELRNKVASRKGFFLTGKFDLQNRKEPYAGILSALADLPAQVSALGETYRSELSARLQDAIGDESHILTVLVPGLKELFPSSDERPSEPSDDKFDTRSVRLHYIFRQFIGSISCPEHPVVFVVDDMHWTDSSSLLLLANLVTDKKLSSFLLLATYREEETDDAHPAIKTFAELQDHPNVALRSISIAALDQMATYSIVSTALRSSEEKTIKLSEIVHQKSNGNAMYTIQFLISLYEDGLLRYNLGLMQWTWDELSVRSRSVTDNVVDLASEKLHRLDSTSRAILQIASCLGQTFDKVKLVYVMDDARVQGLLAASGQADEKPPEESRSDLTSCLDGLVQEAVIDYIHQLDTYCFVHDLIQEAASTLIPEETRAQLQSAVGRRLLQSEMPLDDKFFFRAVELSNIGSDQLDEQEKLKLAQFNETAAHKATAKAAFSSALRYNEEGMRCLGAEAWTKHRALALSLSSGAVEAAFCSGDFATMETRMTSVLSQPIPIEDKVRVYLTRILSYSAQDRNELCLATGRRVLMDMGMTTLPKRPGTQHVILEFLKTKLALRKQTEQSLKELPVLEDERWYQAMSIIDMMQAVAYCSNQNLFAVMNLRLLRWTVKYGVCRFSPTVFATYGIILCTLNEIADGQMMGAVATHLSERLNARSSRSKTIICVYDFIVHWQNHLRTSLKPLLYGHKLGMQTGEVEIAMYNLVNHDFALFGTSATPLRRLITRIQSNNKLMKDYGQEGVRNFGLLDLQFCFKLTYTTEHPTEMVGKWVNENEFRKKYTSIEHALLIQFLENFCLMLAFFFEDYERADTQCRATDIFPQVSGGHFFVPRNAWFRGLTALVMARKGGRQRLAYMKKAARITKQMKRWSDLGNVNSIHMLQLLQAETAAVKGQKLNAKNLYMSAISTASRNGYLNDKALAHERAFLFHLESDSAEDEFWAENHFSDAVRAYCEWEAFQKAKHLVDTYGHRFANVTTSMSIPNASYVEDDSDYFTSSSTKSLSNKDQ